jgi:hypothetical protein
MRSELAELLDHGPFPDALRAAISARELSLDRIQDGLRRDGVPLSVATLSYWQSGRRLPARPGSLRAISHVERILQLTEGSLTTLLEPRGGLGPAGQLLSLSELWSAQPEAATLLSHVDSEAETHLRRLSQYDRTTLGPDRRIRSVRCKQVLRADDDGPDRWLLMFDPGTGSRTVLTRLRHCRRRQVVTLPGSTLVITELLFDRPLGRGETQRRRPGRCGVGPLVARTRRQGARGSAGDR